MKKLRDRSWQSVVTHIKKELGASNEILHTCAFSHSTAHTKSTKMFLIRWTIYAKPLTA